MPDSSGAPPRTKRSEKEPLLFCSPEDRRHDILLVGVLASMLIAAAAVLMIDLAGLSSMLG